MLPDLLKTDSYYINKYPMFLKSDKSLVNSHVYMMLELLKQSDVCIDNILAIMNVFQDRYDEEVLEKLQTFQYLDFLASYFGVSRTMKIGNSKLTFNDYELLFLIKFRASKYSWNGSYEQAKAIYANLDNMSIAFKCIESGGVSFSATMNVYLHSEWLVGFYAKHGVTIAEEDVKNTNIAKLFLNGYLSLESMGISKQFDILNLTKLGIYDVSKYDTAKYGI